MATAFTDALSSRGLLAPTDAGRFDIRIRVLDFNGNQYVRREANVELAIQVVARGSGNPIFQDEVKKNIVRGSIITFDAGVFASPDDLRNVVQDALRQAIDEVIDKPAFRSALRT